MKVRPCFGLIALLTVPVTFVVQAADLETTNSTQGIQQPEVGLWEVLLKMIAALLFVVSVFVLGAWAFKKSRFYSFYKGGDAHLRIIETKSLGYRNHLLVVGYQRQRFLLATSATGVSLISPLPDAVADDATGGGHTAFIEQLNAAQERKT